MITALLCLLTGQHVPNLLSVLELKPDVLVLIESRSMKGGRAAANFRRALELAGAAEYQQDARCRVIGLDSEDDFVAIRRTLSRAIATVPEADWTANVTGGTKPMSIATYEAFHGLGAELVYFNNARATEMLTLPSSAMRQLNHSVPLAAFLAGYGFSISNASSLDASIRRVRPWWELSRLIAGTAEVSGTTGDLNMLFSTPELRKVAREKGIDLDATPWRVRHAGLRDATAGAFGLSSVDGDLCGKLDKYQARFLSGEWLEVFVWGILERHAVALCIHDVLQGVQITRNDAQHARQGDNELDVAFMSNSQALVFAECKTGIGHDLDGGGDTFNKIEAVRAQPGALNMKTMFISTDASVLGKNGKLKQGLQRRSELYRCTVVLPAQVGALAQSPGDTDLVRNTFFPDSGATA